jgi:diguanylate cyclase (GGDEF)-like protein
MTRVVPAPAPLLPLTCLLVALAWGIAALDPTSAWAPWFDNLHWTVSFSLGAWLAARGPNDDAAPMRRWFARGLAGLAIGQLLWNLQMLAGWNPFPAPSDAFFLTLGLAILIGVLRELRRRTPPSLQFVVAQDVFAFALSTLALTLTLYLPNGRNSTPAQMVMLIAYPVLLVAASVAALVLQLHLRLRWTPRAVVLQLALPLMGGLWMAWNLALLRDTQQPGSLMNLGFSVASLAIGWGAAGWRLERDDDPRHDRLCEGLIRLLPLSMVGMVSVVVGLVITNPGRLPTAVENTLFVLALLIMLLSALRQTQQLGERDRLLEAERVLAESRAQLAHLAHHDPLTGLPNQALLRDRVQHALAEARRKGSRVALMFIDLDQFKEVNDTLGHATGDALLRRVAHDLAGVVRATDTVSRQGGDEFVIVLEDMASTANVAAVADKVMALSGGTVRLDGHELPLSMSAGIAIFPDDADDYATLLRDADTAMYKAKGSGRNAYRFYDARMNDETAQRMKLRGALAGAMERGELSLHYQPQVDLASGRLIGAEALLRWQQPDGAWVPPGTFIPVAEDCGLIVPIGAWVLQQACRQATAWQQAGLRPIVMAVNLSVLQFRRDTNLEQTVQSALQASGLEPQWLELEITESVLMQDQDKVFATVERLRALGVGLAIDDFGTGYSSLSYLKRLQPNKLKIDRSFVDDTGGIDGESHDDAAIVRAVIQMADALGVRTVAEGVETPAQRDFLLRHHCQEGQGWLFGRPVPADEFLRLHGDNTVPPLTTC